MKRIFASEVELWDFIHTITGSFDAHVDKSKDEYWVEIDNG